MSEEVSLKPLGGYDKFKKEMLDEDNQVALGMIVEIDKADGNETEELMNELEDKIKVLDVNNRVKNEFFKRLRVLSKRLDRKLSENFASYVRYLREKKDYSLKDVEAITQISPSYINRIEKGERKTPSYPILEKLAFAYDVDISTLLQIAGVQAVEVKREISMQELFYNNIVTVQGRVILNEEKEMLLQIIEKLNSVGWKDKKHIETLEVINLVDQYENIKK